jgi:hypothetical protein
LLTTNTNFNDPNTGCEQCVDYTGYSEVVRDLLTKNFESHKSYKTKTREQVLKYHVTHDKAYPTAFDVLCNLGNYGINPNRFDKLWHNHRHRLGERVDLFDGKVISPSDMSVVVAKVYEPETNKRKLDVILETQSGNAESTTYTGSRMTMTQNVAFADQLSAYTYDAGGELDPTRSLQDTDDADLGNFFSRPLKIHEVEWGTGVALFDSFDPWSEYLQNPRVINRLTNFNLLKAKLHLKIVINGNGFQYGRAIAHYLPFDIFDTLTTTAALNDDDLVQASQMPHIYLDPTTSTGGELILPMFYHKNYINIPSSDWTVLGEMYIRELNTLKHANGATDKVTISVFAWAEDVSMSVLTSNDPTTLTPQSGEIEEANTKGMISEPASAIAKISSALTVVPVIRPFAMATTMAAETIGNIAKMFGYSRPPVTKSPDPFLPRIVGSFANTNVPDPIQKLTVDHAQELTVDPRIAGICAEDPMAIKSIATRESYIIKFPWVQGTAPETLLWNTRVTPVTWAEGGGSPTPLRLPACAMAALPFDYWTGTMRYRFQVVASTFHKGRLKIVYDPEFLESNEYNTNYVQIIDLADTRDFTIEVGVGQDVTLLEHATPGLEAVSTIYSTTPYTTTSVGNGVLAVYVVNELTTPNSTVNNDIEINVFVSAGDDFEVFVPNQLIGNYVLKPQSGEILSPQSGEIVPESENTIEASAPTQNIVKKLGPTEQDTSLINKVFTGETITSFRQMLKRYNLHTAVSNGTSLGRVLQVAQNNFPFLRGNVDGAIHRTDLLAPYNFCNTIMLHWVTCMFSGYRGGVRYKIVPRGDLSLTTPLDMSVERFHSRFNRDYSLRITSPLDVTSVAESGHAAVIGTPAGEFQVAGHMPAGYNGMAYTHSIVNPCLEFEIPYYSPNRFEPGKTQNFTENFGNGFEVSILADGGTNTAFYYYVAAAEDFQVYFFTGAPRLFYEANPPAPEP